jgi:hypothetical protein
MRDATREIPVLTKSDEEPQNRDEVCAEHPIIEFLSRGNRAHTKHQLFSYPVLRV